ncbi:MAG: hypothetical protein AAGA62_06995 [Bacteroidota bacterium]
MSASQDYDEEEPPVDIPHLRTVKIAVAAMTGFLFLAAFGLLMVIFFRLSAGEPEVETAAPFSEAPAAARGPFR